MWLKIELWRAFGLLPERFMLNTGAIQDSHVGYPLRPEFIESLFYLHRATNSSEWDAAVARQELRVALLSPTTFGDPTAVELRALPSHLAAELLAEVVAHSLCARHAPFCRAVAGVLDVSSLSTLRFCPCQSFGASSLLTAVVTAPRSS